MLAQGIGNITSVRESLDDAVWYGYEVEDCVTLHVHRIHVHGGPLEVGKTYYFIMENHDNGCHRVLNATHSEGRHAEAISEAYNDCSECQSNN